MLHQTVNHFERGGLPRPRRTNQDGKAAFAKMQIEIVDRVLLAKGFTDMAKFNHQRSPSAELNLNQTGHRSAPPAPPPGRHPVALNRRHC
ncbi:hypothetical protein D3C81_1805210 [compost metagenome]